MVAVGESKRSMSYICTSNDVSMVPVSCHCHVVPGEGAHHDPAPQTWPPAEGAVVAEDDDLPEVEGAVVGLVVVGALVGLEVAGALVGLEVGALLGALVGLEVGASVCLDDFSVEPCSGFAVGAVVCFGLDVAAKGGSAASGAAESADASAASHEATLKSAG